MSKHEDDLHAWALEQAALIRAGRIDQLDKDGLLEELECVAGREYHALRDSLINIMSLMLAEQQAIDEDLEDITDYRQHADDVLKCNPSLESQLSEIIASAYQAAKIFAFQINGRETSPELCPWTPSEILRLEPLH